MFVRRHKLRASPFRQILSIPGTVALYDPGRQIATGTTGQVLTDYSGRGNHCQLGTTTDSDSNDPAWGDNALVHDADDYAHRILTWDVNSPADHLVVFSSNTQGTSTTQRFCFIHRAWNRFYSIRLIRSWGTSNLLACVSVYDADGLRVGSEITIAAGAAYAYLLRRTATKAQLIDPRNCAVVSEQTLGNHDAGLNYFSTNGERGASFKVEDLSIYGIQSVLRNMTDAEVTRAYHAMSSLMASRGVALA